MAQNSKIEWTDATWNPIRGCTRVSPGCGGPGLHGGCYAESIAARFSKPGQAYHGLAEIRSGRPRWTGKISFGHDLDAPLRWRRPQRIFVNSMSDLFHEGLAVHEIATVYAVCVAAHHLRGHTLQVLTKRSGRMREILSSAEFWEQVNVEAGMHVMSSTDPLARHCNDARATLEEYGPDHPPPGIWLGVSAEDQSSANERVLDLLRTPAAIRIVSAEPLLGQIDFTRIPIEGDAYRDALRGVLYDEDPRDGSAHGLTPGYARLDQVIAGGENGPNARPMHPDWPRKIRNDCAASGTAFFFKQWGTWGPGAAFNAEVSARQAYRGEIQTLVIPGSREIKLAIPTRNDDLLGEALTLERYGKKAAGRLLDGFEHNGMPEAQSGPS